MRWTAEADRQVSAAPSTTRLAILSYSGGLADYSRDL